MGGGGAVDDSDDEAGMAWFNECSESERQHWLLMAASARPADARHAYLLAEAHADTEGTADDWLEAASLLEHRANLQQIGRTTSAA